MPHVLTYGGNVLTYGGVCPDLWGAYPDLWGAWKPSFPRSDLTVDLMQVRIYPDAMKKPLRTIEQRPDHNGFAKAGELIKAIGTELLTLQDRRVLNLLYAAAGPQICDEVEHRVPIRDLRGSHKGAERVKDSVIALMQTLVEIPTTGRNGRPATKRVQLLSDTTVSDDDDDPTGEVVFSLSRGLRSILGRSTHWGRVRGQVMFAFTSKYSLALYELAALRVNLHKETETFGLAEFRALLGVPVDKLKLNSDLLRKVIQPAVLEVNGLADFGVEVEPIRRGGTMRGIITGFRVSWWKKDLPELHEAHAELSRAKVGRLARLSGNAQLVLSREASAELIEQIPLMASKPVGQA